MKKTVIWAYVRGDGLYAQNLWKFWAYKIWLVIYAQKNEIEGVFQGKSEGFWVMGKWMLAYAQVYN